MKNNNVNKISDYSREHEREMAWKKIIGILNRIDTLLTMMPKSLERSNKHLSFSIHEMLDALREYDYLRENEK